MIKRYPIRYHDGRKNRGVKVDWKAVKKEYKRLKIPKKYYYPLNADFDTVGYVISLSDRSRGKTTQILILGLVLYAMYGIQLHYIRQNSGQCEPRHLKNLYQTVLDNGYFQKIFGEEWNDCFYRGKRWYLCHRNEDGQIDKKSDDHFCICIGLNEADSLKSIYNAPLGDMIFFDEFVNNSFGYFDFKNFCDLVKTIGRDRYGVVVYLAANTIDKHSRWFDEYAIAEYVRIMEPGQTKQVVSPLGSHFYIEILQRDESEERAFVNRRLFGFKNTTLDAITGRGAWAEETFPHIPIDDEENPVEMLCNRIFVEMHGDYLKIAIVRHPTIGLCCYVTPATRIYDDSIIFTADDIRSRNYLFGFGSGKEPACVIWDIYKKGLFFYAHNGAGCFLAAYIHYANTRYSAMHR